MTTVALGPGPPPGLGGDKCWLVTPEVGLLQLDSADTRSLMRHWARCTWGQRFVCKILFA